MPVCAYCEQPYEENNSEHLFPHGLGGAEIFVDFVCNLCNRGFSGLELSLMRNSPVALARLSYDLSRDSNDLLGTGNFLRSYAVRRVPEIDNWVLSKIIERHDAVILPQIIQIANGNNFQTVSFSQRERTLFSQIVERIFGIGSTYEQKLSILYSIVFIDIGRNIKQLSLNNQRYDVFFLLKSSLNVGSIDRNLLFNRLFIDELNRINIVANNEVEAKRILGVASDIIVEPNIEEAEIISATVLNNVSTTLKFDLFRANRAAAKIALNILFHYFEELRLRNEFQEIKNYIKHDRSILPYNPDPALAFQDHHTVHIVFNDNSISLSLNLFYHNSYNFHIPINHNLMLCRKIFTVDYANRIHHFAEGN